MDNLLYIIAVTLIAFWAIGFFVYNTSPMIHILLVIAGISVMLRVIQGN